VIDAAEFHNNLDSMTIYEQGTTKGSIAELLTEQVEFSNVVVLNKEDLVTAEQKQEILDRVALLSPNAKVLTSLQSKINVFEILNTSLFKSSAFSEGSFMISATTIAEVGNFDKVQALPDCCIVSENEGKKRCCKKKQAQSRQTVETELSQVMLGVVPDTSGSQQKKTRHETRFGITSFIYKSRRPFHRGRLYDQFLEKFFVLRYDQEEEDSSELNANLDKLQEEAREKQKNRVELMGELLRSKGFVWLASSNFIMGGFQQAGNILRIEPEGPWLCDVPLKWKDTPQEKLVLANLLQENGEEYPHGDRRQELVFIGVGLNHTAIQNILDACLLTDIEMETWVKRIGKRNFQRMIKSN